MTTYVHSFRKAVKRHRCSTCWRDIRPGETYLRGAAFDGGVYTWKECAHCQPLFRYLTRYYGESEYSRELADEWEPESIEHWRIKVQFRRGWERLDGQLYPHPVFEYVYADGEDFPRSYRLRIGIEES